MIEVISISKVIANPNNPRVIRDDKFKKLVKSIQEFPQMLQLRPIVVNDEMVVLGGNMRLRACKEAGLKEVPIIKASNLTEEQQQEFIIKDNVGFGEWDWDDLANNWYEANLKEWGLDFPSFESIEELEAEEDDFEAPDGGIETDIVIGDLFEIGEHRLLCGDSCDLNHIEKLLGDEKPSMIFTDPPYGIGIDGQKKSISSNPKHNRKHHEFMGWDNQRPPEDIFQNILLFNIPTVIFGGNYFADLLPASRGWIYWSKGQDGLTMSDGELAWTNLDKPLRCVTVNRANIGKSVHPTQKPIQVVEFGINYASESGSVLDLFGGSGSTMVACNNLKRKNFTMELEPKYCQVIVDRMLKLDPSLKVLRNGKPYEKAH